MILLVKSGRSVAAVFCFLLAAATAVAHAGEAEAAQPAQAWNLLAKVDFETEGSQVHFQEDRPDKSIPPGTVDRVTEGAQSGQGALRIAVGALSHKEREPGVKPGVRVFYTGSSVKPLDVPTRLRWTVYVRGLENEESGAVFSLVQRDAGKKTLDFKEKWEAVPVGTEWTKVTLEAEIPPGAISVTPQIRFLNPRPGLSLWLDDSSLERLEPVQP